AADLRKAGYARSDVVTPHLLGGVPRQVLHQQRTRSDEAHLASEHIPELGQFIEARASQESAESPEAQRVRKRTTFVVAHVAHRAEFQYRERPAATSWSCLSEEHGSTHDEGH